MVANHIAAAAAGAAVFVVLVTASFTGIAPTNLLTVVSPTLPTPIQHLIVVFFENEPYSALKSNGGSIWQYGQSYALATNFYATCHPSEPNYISATSDGPQGRCGTDNPVELSATSLANLLDTAHESWAQYAQAMPHSCDTTDNTANAAYVVHHVPFLMYKYVTSSSSYCNSHVFAFPNTLSGAAGIFGPNSAPPAYSFITPSNDWNKPISASDQFAQTVVAAWSQDPWWSSTALIFAYDESSDTDTSCPGINGLTGSNCGGHTFLEAVGPYSAHVGDYATTSDQFSLYATSAWLLGLPMSGVTGTPMKGLFSTGSGGGLTASLSVSSASVVVGQTVTLTASASGGTGPYAYSYSSPGAGAGCGTSTSPTLLCTPVAAGNYRVTVTVTDQNRATATASAGFAATSPRQTLALSPLSTDHAPVAGSAYTISASASGGTTPYAFSWSGLPPGCDGATGTGTATCASSPSGQWNVTLTVTDAAGNSAYSSALITVAEGTPPSPSPGHSGGAPLLTTAQEVSLAFAGLAAVGTTVIVLRRVGWGALLFLAGVAGYFVA